MDRTDILYTQEQIAARVAALGQEISADYRGREILVVGILKGAFVFLADLVRTLTVPCRVDFVRLASYAGQTSGGEIRMIKDMELPVAGQEVLIVEDIVDTGLTLSWFAEALRRRRPASLRVCTFLDKRERRRVPFQAHYVGYAIPDHFVVGYGLDCDERYRYFPEIRILREVT